MPRKRQSTKVRIIKAAWNLFYQKGYDKTTVEDIINASKTSKGTFYHYFKGKEALLNSLSYLLDEKYAPQKKSAPAAGEKAERQKPIKKNRIPI